MLLHGGQRWSNGVNPAQLVVQLGAASHVLRVYLFLVPLGAFFLWGRGGGSGCSRDGACTVGVARVCPIVGTCAPRNPAECTACALSSTNILLLAWQSPTA